MANFSFLGARLCRPAGPHEVHPYAGFVHVLAFRYAPAVLRMNYWAARAKRGDVRGSFDSGRSSQAQHGQTKKVATDLHFKLPPILRVPGFTFAENELSAIGLEPHQRIAKLSARPQGKRAGSGWVAPLPIDRVLLAAPMPSPIDYRALWLCPSGWQSRFWPSSMRWAVDTPLTEADKVAEQRASDNYVHFFKRDLWYMNAWPEGISDEGEQKGPPALPRSQEETRLHEEMKERLRELSAITNLIAKGLYRPPLEVIAFYSRPGLSTPLNPLGPYDWRMLPWLPNRLTSLCTICDYRLTRLGVPFCMKCVAGEFTNWEESLRRAENPWAVANSDGETKWYLFLRQDSKGNPPRVKFIDLSRRTKRSIHPVSRTDGMEYLRRLYARGEVAMAIKFHERKFCGARATDLAPNNPDTMRRALNREAAKLDKFKSRPKGERMWPEQPWKVFQSFTDIEVPSDAPLPRSGFYAIKVGGNGVRRMLYLGPVLPRGYGDLWGDPVETIRASLAVALDRERSKALMTAKKEAKRLKGPGNAEQRVTAQFDEIEILYHLTFRKRNAVGTCPVL